MLSLGLLLKRELLMYWLTFRIYFLNNVSGDQNKKEKLHSLIPTRLKIFHRPFQYWSSLSTGDTFKGRGTGALERSPRPRVLASEDGVSEPVPVPMVSCCWPTCCCLDIFPSAQGLCGSTYTNTESGEAVKQGDFVELQTREAWQFQENVGWVMWRVGSVDTPLIKQRAKGRQYRHMFQLVKSW